MQVHISQGHAFKPKVCIGTSINYFSKISYTVISSTKKMKNQCSSVGLTCWTGKPPDPGMFPVYRERTVCRSYTNLHTMQMNHELRATITTSSLGIYIRMQFPATPDQRLTCGNLHILRLRNYNGQSSVQFTESGGYSFTQPLLSGNW